MQRPTLLTGSAALALASAATLGLTSTASAAPVRGGAYNGACGSGYGVVNSVPVGAKGTVYLTYSAKTGKNCVVTVRNSPGKPVFVLAELGPSDHSSDPVFDSGTFTTYAGPVYLAAKGRCVDWGGAIESVSVRVTASNCGRLAPGTVVRH
ncbi:spore-associated protein A [Streptomyces sp. NRRL F-4489]|uniref:spore-associated protein A n=1 Tax=Streptomyces sp. NRRL F-4489 TaxID=1609095 RepID=UPI00074B28C4|nr:spore-associated protein A [Streptomyces sp. NRRL F-4489]KUL47655.1 spore-associated protein A [Streptomyces sp. NRRL F-4489]